MPPETAPLHREGTIAGSRNRRLYWQAWLPDRRPEHLIVVAHGACEHSGRYARLATHLVERGCAVYALDHRGHGRSEGVRALFEHFAYAENDFDRLVTLAIKEAPHCRPLILGHSLGGIIALSHALKHQARLHGLILSAPALSLPHVPALQMTIARILSLTRPTTPLYPIDAGNISRDPGEVAAYDRDPLNYHGKVPARTMVEVLNRLSWLPATYRVIRLPLLLMHGTADRLAADAGSRDLFDRTGSADRTLHLYEGYYHEIFNEPPADRQHVYDDLDAWIAAHPQGD